MAVPVVVIKVAVSFSKTPVVATVMVGKVTVTAPELSSAAAFGKITATHVRSTAHAMRAVSAHRMGSTAAHSMGSTTAHRVGSTTASHLCATTASAAPAPSAATPTTVGYEG
jgi:hypothetical protein